MFHVKHAGRPRHAGPACRGAPEGALRGGEGLAANGAGPAGRVIDCGVRSRCSRRHLQVGRLAISRRVASRPRAALARTDYQGKDEREDCADDSRSASTAPPRKRTVHPASIASGNTPQERGGLVDRGRGFRSAGKRGANRAAWARTGSRRVTWRANGSSRRGRAGGTGASHGGRRGAGAEIASGGCAGGGRSASAASGQRLSGEEGRTTPRVDGGQGCRHSASGKSEQAAATARLTGRRPSVS